MPPNPRRRRGVSPYDKAALGVRVRTAEQHVHLNLTQARQRLMEGIQRGEVRPGTGQYAGGYRETLFIGAGGYVTCSHLKCPCPDAVATILGERETEHVVQINKKDFAIIHPLRERLQGELLDCDLHRHMNRLSGPPAQPGRYRAVECANDRGGMQWTWEPTGDAGRVPETGGTDG